MSYKDVRNLFMVRGQSLIYHTDMQQTVWRKIMDLFGSTKQPSSFTSLHNIRKRTTAASGCKTHSSII